MPGFSPPQISPDVNPQVTGSDARCGWDVVAGCWYVKVSAPGYAPKISALVGVPPAVTDLHVALQPAAACNPDLDGDGSTRARPTRYYSPAILPTPLQMSISRPTRKTLPVW